MRSHQRSGILGDPCRDRDRAPRSRTQRSSLRCRGCPRLRHTRRHPSFRYRRGAIRSSLDGPCGGPAAAGRQRHHHRRHRSAGVDARQARRGRQGRGCRPSGARHSQDQATAAVPRASVVTSDAKPERKANRRGAARLAAVQALYQMDIARTPLNEILAEFESHWLGREVEGSKYLPAEAAFFREIVAGFLREQRNLDPLIDRALAGGWPLKRVEALLRAVLRAGAFELDQRRDVPARVVISEYVDVANAFLDGEETGMVNAVLDLLARQFRSGEFDRAAG